MSTKRTMPRCFAWAALAAVLAGACASGSSAPGPARCAKDADCRLFSDYCDGCACRALAAGQGDPVCKGTIVTCLVDPCEGKQAACNAGTCAVR
jgi:hypothetical protein